MGPPEGILLDLGGVFVVPEASLVDLQPGHVERAGRLDVGPGRVTVEVGDARALPMADGGALSPQP